MAGRPSHPPTLLRLVQRELKAQELVTKGQRVVAAVSGGPDSMAMLHALGILGPRLGFEVVACAIDHGLRPEAADELCLAQGLADRLGVGFELVRLQVAEGSNLMARARTARLEALQRVADEHGAQNIALGHHADDRAETVLMRLLRGAGPAGLAVMPPRAGIFIRPMIRARRSDILAHLSRHGVAFAEDPSNRNRRFLRACVRHDVLPRLAELSPRVVEHLCDLADDLEALGARSAGSFKREHLRQIAKAAATGSAAIQVALPGGRTAHFDKETGTIRVEQRQVSGGRPNPQDGLPDPNDA